MHLVGYPGEADICPWLCGGPSYPTTPFASPVFIVVDTLRIVMAIGAFALIMMSVWAIRCSSARGQKTRFAFAMMLALSVFGTELEHLGDWPNWRFLVNGVGIVLGIWGYYQHLYHERPAIERRPDEKARCDP